MRTYFFPEVNAAGTYAMLVSDLLDTDPIQVGEWQAMDVSKSDLHKTHELEDITLTWERVPSMAGPIYSMIPYIDGDWAAEHFEERVSGKPLNPAPSHVRWPYAVRGNADHTTDQVFDHTYPERFWPTHPGHMSRTAAWNDPVTDVPVLTPPNLDGMQGIRFRYGDLGDVVDLLARSPLTRQAYLPVWFPEDTGSHHGQRVPCTLGYHFMQRGGRLSVRYYLRSCDVYRHMSNDVFFTAALLNWVCNKVNEKSAETATPMHFRPGKLVMHISSLHAFVGDTAKLVERLEKL